MKKIILVIFLIALSGCGDHEVGTTYFGGQIINPKSDEVILFKNDVPVDTAKLDTNNRFLFTFDNLPSGLYSFRIQPEYQSVILEKGDSLLLRLNTYDFDESLVYSGKGAKKNNILVTHFLQDEKEKDLILWHYMELNPKEFKAKIDSLHKLKAAYLDQCSQTRKMSDLAKQLLLDNINYTLYRYTEIYPYFHHKYHAKVDFDQLDSNFYSYRKNLDFNNKELSYFPPFEKFMKLYSAGESYKHTAEEQPDLNAIEILQSFEYHKYRLKLFDSVVQTKETRDNLFRTAAYMFFLDEKRNAQMDEEYFALFKKYSPNNIYFSEIQEVYANLQHLKKGNRLQNVKFIDATGNLVGIADTNNEKLTVYYFWALNQENHFRNIIQRIHLLEKNFPKVHFVGVNNDLPQTEWIKTVKLYKLDLDNQYRIENFDSVSRKLIINKMNKAIITNMDGTIIDAFADIYDTNLETILSSYRGKLMAQNISAKVK